MWLHNLLIGLSPLRSANCPGFFGEAQIVLRALLDISERSFEKTLRLWPIMKKHSTDTEQFCGNTEKACEAKITMAKLVI